MITDDHLNFYWFNSPDYNYINGLVLCLFVKKIYIFLLSDCKCGKLSVYVQLSVDMDKVSVNGSENPRGSTLILFLMCSLFKHIFFIFIVNTWFIVKICKLQVHLRVPDFLQNLWKETFIDSLFALKWQIHQTVRFLKTSKETWSRISLSYTWKTEDNSSWSKSCT